MQQGPDANLRCIGNCTPMLRLCILVALTVTLIMRDSYG